MTLDDVLQNNLNMAEMRRERILEETMNSVLNVGFKKTGLKNIAKACGMSVGHIYYYFKNKDEIIDLIIQRATDNFLELITEASQRNDDQEALRISLRHTVDLYMNNRKGRFVMMMVFESFEKPELRDMMIQAGVRIRDYFIKKYHADVTDPEKIQLLNARMVVVLSMLDGLRLSNHWHPDVSMQMVRDVAVDVLYAAISGWQAEDQCAG